MMLDSALKIAGLGWPIIPVRKDKTPATPHGSHDATLRPAQIEAWFITNPDFCVALATGSTSGIVILDVDLYKPGVKESFDKFKAMYNFSDSPVRSLTGRGGIHHFFKIPDGEVYNNAVDLNGFTGIDIRGEGGYVILPPSVNPDGNYVWLAGCSPFEISELPIAPKYLKKGVKSVSLKIDSKAEKERFAETARNNSLTSLGGRLRAAGMEYDSILTELISANESKFKKPLEFDEVEKIAKSVCRYPAAPNINKLSEEANNPVPTDSTATEIAEWLGRSKNTSTINPITVSLGLSTSPVIKAATQKQTTDMLKKKSDELAKLNEIESDKSIELKDNISTPLIKPKRKRRTKKEMAEERARAEAENIPVSESVPEPEKPPELADQETIRWRDMLKFPATDVGRSELVESLNRGNIKYHNNTGKFHLWDGVKWKVDDRNMITEIVKKDARLLQQATSVIIDDDERRKAHLKAIGFENLTKITACISLLKSIPSISTGITDWDTRPELLGVGNGVVNLKNGTLLGGRKDILISLNTNVNYNPEATCPRWEQFLEEIFQGDQTMIDYVHVASGYTLTGETKEQAIFLLVGEGSNGKSVFLNTLRYVMGNYSSVASFATFEKQMTGSSPSHDLANLMGCRLVTSSETSSDTVFNEARLKMLSGEETISARRLYQEPFNYKPTLKLFLAVNHLPKVRDTTLSFWRRIKRIDFNRTFTETEVDPNLSKKLEAEAEGILAWLVRGAVRWFAEGLKTPESVTRSVEKYRNSTNNIDDFLDNHTEPDPNRLGVSGEDLYTRYVASLRMTNVMLTSLIDKEVFLKLVERRIPSVRDNHNRLMFPAIKLSRDTHTPEVIINHLASDKARSNGNGK